LNATSEGNEELIAAVLASTLTNGNAKQAITQTQQPAVSKWRDNR
jgi:hypothetical protein